MGASAWDYWTAYTPDAPSALERLRQEAFQSGEYFKFDDQAFATVEELIEYNEDAGTHSIIDMERVVPEMEDSDGVVWPATDAELEFVLGTRTPTHDLVEQHKNKLIDLVDERWAGRYLVAYKDDQPDELFFFGISGD